MDSDEFLDLTDHLGKKPDECLEFLSSVQASGWVKLKDREADSKLGLGRISQCHFLGDDGKTCQIYEARPTQCYSFPYWPRLIESKEAWDEEAVVPDDVQGKHWSASSGGCEGMNHPESNRAEFKEIKVNSELYKAYHSTFFEDTTLIKNEDEHTATFMGIVDVKNSVKQVTKSWVENFVMKYDLCPFASSVFVGNTIRYRTFMNSEANEAYLLSWLRAEILHLLAVPESQCSTTLLMFPFAFKDFKGFHQLSEYIEDEFLPSIEDELLGPISELSGEPLPDIQLAFFHPNFQWAGEADDAPINFEKKAPFPTINILRAARVRAWADGERTEDIGNSNSVNLETAGTDTLKDEFVRLITSSF
jgi:Fe-S-cluster containining protein